MTENTKTTKAITATINQEEMELILGFAHGEEIKISAEALDEEIQRTATMHGLKQKLVDAAAISRDPVTGKSATIETKYDAVYEVYQRLLNGEWNKRRESAGPSGGLLFQALVRLYPDKAADDLREFVTGKTKSEQAALRANPKIAKVIEEIRAERATGIDTEDMLDELETI